MSGWHFVLTVFATGLFLGFGGLFLLLSYHLRNLWNPCEDEDAAEPHVS